MKIKFKRWFKDVFSIVEKHWFKLLSAAILRTFLATLASGLIFALTVNYTYLNLVLATITHLIVWSWLETGLLKMILCASRGQTVGFGQLFSEIKLAPIFFILFSTYLLATSIGIIVLVVPGMFVCIRFSVAGLELIDKKKPLIESLKSSLRLTLGYSRLIAPLFLIGITLYFSPLHLQFIIELVCTIALVVLYLNMTENASNIKKEVQV